MQVVTAFPDGLFSKSAKDGLNFTAISGPRGSIRDSPVSVHPRDNPYLPELGGPYWGTRDAIYQGPRITAARDSRMAAISVRPTR